MTNVISVETAPVAGGVPAPDMTEGPGCQLPTASAPTAGLPYAAMDRSAGRPTDRTDGRTTAPGRRLVELAGVVVIVPVVALLILLMIVVLPPLGVSYYAAKGWVRLLDRIGLGD